MRLSVVFFLVFLATLGFSASSTAATNTVYYRGYCVGADGCPIGIGLVDESEIGKELVYKFVMQDGELQHVERLGGGKRLSTRLTYENGSLVRAESYSSKGRLSSVKTYTYNADRLVATETYMPQEKGKEHQGHTTGYSYDQDGRPIEIRTEQTTGSARVEVYEHGVLVERHSINRDGRLSFRRRYVYGPRSKRIWEKEQILDEDGTCIRETQNALLRNFQPPERPELRPVKTMGDDAELSHLKVTHPAFSPANSRHVKDTTRLSVMLNYGRPLRLELNSPATGSIVRTLSRPHVWSKGHAHFKWEGVLETGEMAPDGVYATWIRTPVVRLWQAAFLDRGAVGHRLLDCTDTCAYVCDPESARVIVFNTKGDIERVIELAVDKNWGPRKTWPSSLDVVQGERLYLTYGGRLRIYDMDGALLDEIEPQLEGLPWVSRFGVDEQGTVYCTVEHTHSSGKGECGFTVLELDERGRAVRVLAQVTGLSPERGASPFVHQGVLYLNAFHFPHGDYQRVLMTVDLATGKRRLIEHTSTVTDAGLRTPPLLAAGDVEFHDSTGVLVMGFDCGWRTVSLQGSRVYSLTNLGSVLRCYETASDKVLLEGELIVDNTAPAASITYPGPDGLIAGEPDRVEITGLATDVNFEKYEVFWRPATGRNWRWRLLEESDTACAGGTLAVWDTTKVRVSNIKNRDIELRLVVTDKAGNTTKDGFAIRYDADDDGFSNEFENTNRDMDKNTRTERCTARIVPYITLMLRREFPINGSCPLDVQLVDEATGDVLNRGVLEFAVNAGTIQSRVHVRTTTSRTTASWRTPSSVEPSGVLTVTLPPQGIHNVWYTAEPFEISLPLVVDSDFDGLTDEYENSTDYGYGAKTSPTNPDTDGDGIDDLYDLSPTQAPTQTFTEDYPVGALRFKQTYHVISIAGDGSKVTKNGINVGRWPLMDKSISDNSVKDYFNDEVFKISSDDPLERSPLHVIAAERKETYDCELASERTYTAPAGRPKYVFKYTTKEFLYELSVANREVTKYPVSGVRKYGFISTDVSLRNSGGNTIAIQFKLGSVNRWRDDDDEGSFTKMFMRYALYNRGTVTTDSPYYTGLVAVEWAGQNRFQCHLVLPDDVYDKMREQNIPSEQAIVFSPVWVEHRAGSLPCMMHKEHPLIPPKRDSCLLCSYRPKRDIFTPVYTKSITLTALGMRYDHYACTAIGRLSARANGPAVNADRDYETLTAVFEHFHPRRGSAGRLQNGLVPVTINGTLYQVLYLQDSPGTGGDPAQFLTTHVPNADAVVFRAGSSWHLNELIEVLKGVVAEHNWAGQWAFVDSGGTPSNSAGPDTSGQHDADDVQQQAGSALDKIETLGTRFKEVREVAEFAVDVSNMPAGFKADQLSAELMKPTVFGSMMSSTTQTSHNVAVTKLASGKIEVALQRRAMFSAKRSGGKIVSTRYYVKTVKTEQVDDLAESKIATQYGVVNKIPTQLIVGAKIGATLMTDGVELYKAIQRGDGVDIVYYGTRGTANVLAALGSASIKWKNTSLFKGIQLTKTAKFNTVAAVVATIDVGYNVFKMATADTWLGRAAYAEKTSAAVVDGVIGCIEPYGAAVTIGWQVGVFAGEKICDKLGWGESTELSRSVTGSIGSMAVFLFEEFSLTGIPTAHANDAGTRVQNKLSKQVQDHNAYLNERNRQDPRQLFIAPDVDD